MTNDDKYKRAVSLAARGIKHLRRTVHMQSAAIVVLSAAVILLASVRRKERKHDPP